MESSVPRTRQYKKVEKKFFGRVRAYFKQLFDGFGKNVTAVSKKSQRKLTIMVVPHSQKKVLNFQTTVLAFTLGCILFVGVVLSFVFFTQRTVNTDTQIALLKAEKNELSASLDELRDENNNLLQAAKRFQTSLSNTLSLVGLNRASNQTRNSVQNGDLASLVNVQDFSQGSLRETAEIKELTSYLDGAIKPIEEIAKLLESQGTLFSDIPSIWPIKGGIGHVSMAFGHNEHPITGQWYVHKGLDISTWRSGDPIVATANGQVVTVGYLFDLGKYVVIKHKHGIFTRYAHMNSTRVQQGSFVKQGDIIGTIGNTGISTGPHLHYEVRVGAGVDDPAKYINVSLTN